MAYFAKIGTGNKVVRVTKVDDTIATTEQSGVDFLNNLFETNDVWKQTFQDGSQRKHYAGVGYKYDSTRDAFIPIKPFYKSKFWILNEDTCIWECSIPCPDDGKRYKWNETTNNWDEII